MTLADVLAPLTTHQFLTDYVGERYLQMSGSPGRFRELVSWNQLNAVLAGVRVDDGRVRLVKHGRDVPSASYIYESPSGRIKYLIGPSITSHVLNGATLIVNQVDELLPCVRQLVESFEETFDVHIGANLYAAWRTDNGFDVHWDKHDTLIVQVLGRKNWKVWQPTRLHPLISDAPHVVPSPTGDPIWHGMLGDGDILYMPRGWWHVAWACDEPSLHITISVRHHTGADLLQWVSQVLRASTAIRQDVPHWRKAEEQVAWLQLVSDAFTSALHEHVIDDYMDAVAEKTQPRPIVRLPEMTSPSQARASDADCLLRLVHVRRLRMHAASRRGMLTFRVAGQDWECHELLRPALERLRANTPSTVQELLNAVEAKARPMVRPFLAALIADHVIWEEHTTLTANHEYSFCPP